MYYLQSLYYNPDTCRMLNADGIIGQTGELLGHNLFVYCKNTPINASDPSGFRLVYDAVNPDLQPGNQTIKVISNEVYYSAVADLIGDVNGVVGSQTGSTITQGMDMYVGGKIASTLLKSKSYDLDGTLGFTRYIKNPGNLAKSVSGVTKIIGVLGVASLGIGIWDNNVNYEHSLSRTLVDLVAFGAGIVAGVAIGAAVGTGVIAIGATLFAGAVISFGASKIKDTWYDESKRRR